MNALKANQVGTLPAGVYVDGAGLRLKVGKTGSRNWVMRYTFNGQAREIGLGGAATVPLAVARAKRDEMLALINAGKDPLEEKQAAREIPTFDEAAAKYIAAKWETWRNLKHREQWKTTLATYASPVIGHIKIDQITPAHIIKVLEPVWKTKHPTAIRLLGRLHQVLGAARYSAGITGTNPAEYKGYLENATELAHKPTRANFASLPHAQTGQTLRVLMASNRVADLALAFTILTAARTGSAIGARWDEIDMDAKTWSIPGERMKMAKEFTVPLSDAAIQVLDKLKDRHVAFVFPSPNKPGSPISNAAMGVALRKHHTQAVAVPHGFRASFRTWAGDSGVDFEVAEECLAHSKGDSVVKAYHRSTLLERRRTAMERWAAYLTAEPVANVVPMLKIA
jgi:integrase